MLARPARNGRFGYVQSIVLSCKSDSSRSTLSGCSVKEKDQFAFDAGREGVSVRAMNKPASSSFSPL